MLVDLLPREPASGVRFQIGDEPVGVAAALLVPDQLVEHQLVTDVGVAGRHEPRQHGEGVVVRHRVGDRPVVAVAEDHASTHQVVRRRDARQHVVEGLDAELLEEFSVVVDGRGAPRVEGHIVGSFRPAVAPDGRRALSVVGSVVCHVRASEWSTQKPFVWPTRRPVRRETRGR